VTTTSQVELTEDEFTTLITAAAKHDIANAHLALSAAYTGKITPHPYMVSLSSSDSGMGSLHLPTGGNGKDKSPDQATKELKDLLTKLPAEARKPIDDHLQDQKKSYDNLSTKTQENAKKRVKGIQGEKGGMSQEAFEKSVKDDAKRDIEDYAKRRNKIADHLIELGKKHPQQRSLLAAISHGISKFFSDLWNTIVSFVADLFQKIAEWLTTAWQKVKEFFERVGNWLHHLFS
jgi:hypothetical protein